MTVRFRFTLVGAYYAALLPLEAKRLDVEIRMDMGTVRVAPFQAKVEGTVRADGLAMAAAASGTLRGGLAGAHCSFDFTADDTRALTLSCSQSLARVTVRSLTELTGSITEQGTGTLLGRVRLRYDVRRALGL